jgi:hypothetical protein
MRLGLESKSKNCSVVVGAEILTEILALWFKNMRTYFTVTKANHYPTLRTNWKWKRESNWKAQELKLARVGSSLFGQSSPYRSMVFTNITIILSTVEASTARWSPSQIWLALHA